MAFVENYQNMKKEYFGILAKKSINSNFCFCVFYKKCYHFCVLFFCFMQSFNHFLREKGVSNEIRSLLYHIARAVKYINFSLRSGNTGTVGTQNTFGEDQLKLDVLSDEIIETELEKSELAAFIASEEKEESKKFPAPRGKFVIAYDPLDGSSLVDSNLAIGSIFGIWPGEELVGRRGNEMEAAC